MPGAAAGPEEHPRGAEPLGRLRLRARAGRRGRRRQLRARQGRVPRRRRRVGLRQVDARLRDRAAAGRAARRRDHERPGALQGPGHGHALRQAAAAHPLARLLGRDAERDERAQPGADDRRPDARRVRGALDDVEAADRGPLEGGPAPGLDRPGAPAELPAPALGRDAPARDDRDGAPVHAGADRHGRADLGPRRGRPAVADGADQGAAGAARLRGHLRHARHVARAPLLRPAARDVRGAGGRAGADAAAVRQAAAPVHAGPAGGVPVDPRREGAPARDPGLAAGPAAPTGRLPLRAALPACLRAAATTSSRACSRSTASSSAAHLHEQAAAPVEARKEGVA